MTQRDIVKFSNGKYGIRISNGRYFPKYRYMDLNSIGSSWSRGSSYFIDCQGTLSKATKIYEQLYCNVVEVIKYKPKKD